MQVTTRRILKQEDMVIWIDSQIKKEIKSFILHLSESIQDMKFQQLKTTICVEILFDILTEIELWIEEFPPIEGSQRYGNVAFRSWQDKLEKLIRNKFLKFKIGFEENILKEISEYFIISFGNKTRIDYGTGHELAFVIFLYCLNKTNKVEFDPQNIVLIIFKKYCEVVFKLVKTYRLEPAGSHGVWGLDDYHFLGYIFGSSQLIKQNEIVPRDILNLEKIQKYKRENFYFFCIDNIYQFKTGPFNEHSPVLYDISTNVLLWSKVHSGLIKMYDVEVLDKFPVVQHLQFGTLFSMD